MRNNEEQDPDLMNETPTHYITKEVKHHVKEVITDYVWAKSLNSDMGKRLQEVRKQIVEDIRDIADVVYPPKEIKVLEKFDLIDEIDILRLTLEDGKVMHSFFNASFEVYIDIDPPIIIPYSTNERLSTRITDMIHKFQDTHDRIAEFIKEWDLFACENKKIIGSYMKRIESFRTMNQIKKNCPNMIKFFPVGELSINRTFIPDSEKIIHAFEQGE